MTDHPDQTPPQSPDSGAIDKQSITGGAVQQQLAGEQLDESRRDLDELRAILDRFYADKRNYKRKDHNAYSQAVQELEQLITTRLRAQLNSLEDEGPEERHIPAYDHTTTLNANYGFNEACDQWRTLLAKKRDTL